MAARWQYRNNDFKFVDFTKKDSLILEKQWAKNTEKTTLDIKGQSYTIDLKHFTQTNDSTQTSRMIRRMDPDSHTGAKHVWTKGPQWEWESKPLVFTPYDPATNDLIDAAFLKDALRVQVSLPTSAHSTQEFVVHFGHMHQENIEGGGVRRVRRVMKDIAPPTSAVAAEDVKDDDSSRQKLMAEKLKRDRETEVVAKGPAAPVGPVDVSALPQEKDWTLSGSVLLLLLPHPKAPGDIKIAGFDMDDTMVFPKNGATFAKSRTDWQWLAPTVVPKLHDLHKQGFRIVIFTNQSGIANKGWDEKKASEIKGKIIDLSAAMKIPLEAVIATKEDEFRKPCTNMWDLYKERTGAAKIDMDESFYCGDAAGRSIATLAGRKKDFSCSDRKFAYNLGIKFFTPEEFFNKQTAAPFEWDGLGPADLKAIATSYPLPAYHVAHQELVIMVGYPGCGKSTFYRRFFQPHGYQHVNRDTLKTPEKCIQATSTFLAQKKSVVVDNTNPAAEDRAKYISIAAKLGIPVRCFVMLHDKALANHMNILRARLGLCARVSSIAYNMFKSKYEAVSVKEGVTVVEIPPVANFDDLPSMAKSFFYQLS